MQHMMAVMPIMMLAPAPAMQTAVYDGRPAFSRSLDLGYYVWREGDKWHVRWTTKNRGNTFAGSVTAMGGKLKSLRQIDVAAEWKILNPGGRLLTISVDPGASRGVRSGLPVFSSRDRDHSKMEGDSQIVFNARTENNIDGFDFTVDDVDELQINLEIDGRALPNRVAVGRKNEKPLSLPLTVTLR